MWRDFERELAEALFAEGADGEGIMAFGEADGRFGR